MNKLSLISPEFPIWNKEQKILINHYKSPQLINLLNLLEELEHNIQYFHKDPDIRLQGLTVARLITKLNKPPGPVMMWVDRVLKIYYSIEIKNAVIEGRIPARFALCDLANRVGDRKFIPYINRACDGTLTNQEFRTISKKFKGTI